jgi:hypothetical protein
VARRASATGRTLQRKAASGNGDRFCFPARKPVRAGIFVETGIKKLKAPSGAKYAAPLVAVRKNLDLVWVWFYKDFAPTALFKGANPAK